MVASNVAIVAQTVASAKWMPVDVQCLVDLNRTAESIYALTAAYSTKHPSI
jgi:hypothetical protein